MQQDRTMSGKVAVGVSGWSYADWRGVVYPARRPRGFSELAHVASFLGAVELNMSFYRPPTPAMAEGWLRRISAVPDFLFTAKLWQRFTHERENVWSAAEAQRFKEGIRPLAEAGKLGALLAQFPWSFRATQENRDWLRRVADAFGDLPCVVEVRHASWNADETAAFLRQHRLNFCNVDQPRARDSLGMTNLATGPIAYYRFHGRNRRAWFSKDAGRDARYDYLYAGSELAPWIDSIAAMADRVQQIFVMNNNHYRGQAVVNALQIKAALTRRKVAAPPSLVGAYPVLRDIARPPPGQTELAF